MTADTLAHRRTAPDLKHRREVLVQLLERYDELTDPGGRHGGSGSGHVPLRPHARRCELVRPPSPEWTAKDAAGARCTCWQQDVIEVERLLALMRNQGKQQAYGGVSLGTLRWHVMAYYVEARVVRSWRPKPLVKGRRLQVPKGQDVLRDASGKTIPAELVERPVRDPQARKEKADLGVEWMAERWSLGHEPALPMEVAA